MTVPTMKWSMSDDGQWVRRCFDLTITPEGKSDRLSILTAPNNIPSRKDASDVRR